MKERNVAIKAGEVASETVGILQTDRVPLLTNRLKVIELQLSHGGNQSKPPKAELRCQWNMRLCVCPSWMLLPYIGSRLSQGGEASIRFLNSISGIIG